MERSVGKITWGYIWRLILWSIAISFVFTFILNIIINVNIADLNVLDVNSVAKAISSLKINVIGTIVINIISIILACRYATSGVINKFDINRENKQQVIRNIMIVLTIWATLTIIGNIQNLSTIENTFSETEETISDLRSGENSDKLDKAIKELEELYEMTKVAVPIVIVSNVVVILGMIPYERKWIDKSIADIK